PIYTTQEPQPAHPRPGADLDDGAGPDGGGEQAQRRPGAGTDGRGAELLRAATCGEDDVVLRDELLGARPAEGLLGSDGGASRCSRPCRRADCPRSYRHPPRDPSGFPRILGPGPQSGRPRMTTQDETTWTPPRTSPR